MYNLLNILLYLNRMSDISTQSNNINLGVIQLSFSNINFYIKTFNNKELHIKDFWMKYFILLSSLLLIRYVLKLLKKFSFFTKNKIKTILPLEPIKPNKWITILGFGDNEVSITISKYFANRGYNLLLLVCPKILKVRKEYNLNQIQELDKFLNIKILEYDYETFIKSEDFTLDDGKGEVEFIFDTSVLRLYCDEISNNDKITHVNSFYYNQTLSNWVNQYMSILDKIKTYFLIKSEIHPIKLYQFHYPDKDDEVNHKLFFEIRKSIYKQYEDIYKKTLLFNVIKYYNEFKGYYLKESQLKNLEIINIEGNGYEIDYC